MQCCPNPHRGVLPVPILPVRGRAVKRENLAALTIHQPWAWSIAESTKRIENRTWRPPARIVGKYIAIHAGAQPRTKRERHEMLAQALGVGAPPGSLVFGAVVAVARVIGFIDTVPDPVLSPHWAWWVGPLAWELDNVTAMPTPIKATGKQGLWQLDSATTQLVRLQWRAAHGKLTEDEAERMALQDPATH